MRISSDYKIIAEDVDISKIRQEILSTEDSEWEQNTFRQDTFLDVTKDTETIILKFNFDDNPADTTEFSDVIDRWYPILEPVIAIILEKYPNTFMNKCMLPKLKAGGEIVEHIDMGKSLTWSHRIHVPIITNKDVIFNINNTSFNMEEGKIYEINNQELHSVVNGGETDRVHLLIDLYPKRKK